MNRPSLNMPHADRLYIGGRWVAPASAETCAVLNCATEDVVAHAAMANEADVDAAVRAARDAFDRGPWPHLSPAERAAFLEKIAARLEALNDEFARGWSIESGVLYRIAKPRIGLFLSGAFRQYAAMAQSYPFVAPARAVTGHQAYRVQEPVGVVAVIVPWNGPAGLLAYKIAPALLAGCTVVIKNSPETPSSGHLFAQICDEVGLPPGVVNMLTADRTVSESLVRHPGVDKITFTGSTGAGRRIGAVAAERVARVTLELGGKSPAVVLDDYDVETAAKMLGASYFGYLSGQVCHSLTRIIVPRAKHDRMVDALVEAARGMVLGDPLDDATSMGPLATAAQRDVVERLVAQGVSDGARLAIGGKRPAHLARGFFFEPTVFANVDNRSRIAQNELFGPVLSVIPADSEQHAIDMANDTIFGLNAAVFTHDTERALQVARRLRAGSVGHNASRTDFSIGFGGFKQSGVGREGGTGGLEAFLESKTVVLDQPAA
ncbi:aldehyde dehydrogenase [Burkholderia pseudomultivorans]|uniref:Geranial dehydrogenase n=1 Tax=Burkholderia pseudomultivorans TaxID=1207504 RepID=A0ABU2E3E4_9BURK|nr:aldehyde dehydrogenase [Burkholderia pseudomultivorans]MDR8725982.1 Geranial dehydrogenase [Burkholderia pseudomultivorans]MDR8735121.1 Geranial dehydrogenase [Burkholderia pseudomultivorans]MDR8741058.1 Geranial dehydrogenase [Burkholderia pseudomultivorans]MDR8754391.1 Geranial dehydrogenase [Burkholderia pseudomultivorans]MDR8777501.1 Geranial dehydrogenase [Burkholderia pseudomultivorans]